jgi:DNA-binding transcriptional regulator GbsR (MarR family)
MNDQRAGMPAALPSTKAGGASAAVAAATPEVADEAALRFIEDTALLYEQAGHPRMAGRILAWLMICDPPFQTAGRIATALSASKASVSTNIRLFVDFGIVEKFTMPADRRDYYRLLSTMWPRAMERSLPLLTALREVADRGLTLVEGHPEECRVRVREMRDFYSFYEQGLRELVARWKEREGGEGA